MEAYRASAMEAYRASATILMEMPCTRAQHDDNESSAATTPSQRRSSDFQHENFWQHRSLSGHSDSFLSVSSISSVTPVSETDVMNFFGCKPLQSYMPKIPPIVRDDWRHSPHGRHNANQISIPACSDGDCESEAGLPMLRSLSMSEQNEWLPTCLAMRHADTGRPSGTHRRSGVFQIRISDILSDARLHGVVSALSSPKGPPIPRTSTF